MSQQSWEHPSQEKSQGAGSFPGKTLPQWLHPKSTPTKKQKNIIPKPTLSPHPPAPPRPGPGSCSKFALRVKLPLKCDNRFSSPSEDLPGSCYLFESRSSPNGHERAAGEVRGSEAAEPLKAPLQAALKTGLSLRGLWREE